MEKKNFHKTITVNASAEEAVKKINQVNLWWAKDFSGESEKLGDKFTIRFGTTFVDFTIAELIPGKKVVWKVTDCFLPWLHDKKEWDKTDVVYEISEDNNTTKIDFTHVGLVPGIECFDQCSDGWTRFATVSLPKFINEGEGLPE